VFTGVGADLKLVADFKDARRFGGLAVAAYVARIAGGRGEGAGPKEACRPEPFVNAQRTVHS
jgi:hypothetical protein